MTTAAEALQRLIEGNERYVSGARERSLVPAAAHRSELVAGQSPFAVILGCADSRLSAALVFDQGLGDLFVIRVAGNIAAESQIGSIEYAVEHLGTRLVVVLGHSGCGAVAATIEQVQRPADASPNLVSIVKRIQPAVEPLVGEHTGDELLRRSVRANVRTAAQTLREAPVLMEHFGEGGLRIVGAEYDLGTGRVEFFDGVEEG